MPRVLFFDLDETLVAQEKAFSAAYRATAEWLSGELFGVGAACLASRIPAAVVSALAESPLAVTLERCRFGGRDVLWGDPGTDSSEAGRITALAPALRAATWSALLEPYPVDPLRFVADLNRRFRVAMFSAIDVFPDVGVALERLARHYRLAVITNGMGTAQREKLEHLGLGHFFERVIASTDVGEGKPSGEIFAAALREMDVPASGALMLGDSLDGDVRGAQAAGIRAVWLERSAGSAPGNGQTRITSLQDWSPERPPRE
jgi:putative hydrolase of the HAD superfamily